MTISKLTNTVKPLDEINKINELVDGINACFHNIGEIVASTIPLTDAGLHLLDGSLISGSGSYSAFVDYIASIYDASANYFCSEADWQSAVTTYGVCGKFVYDSVNNTVRLPKYNNKIYTGGGTANVKGNGTTIGLTDGTRNMGMFYSSLNYGPLYGFDNSYDVPVGTSATTASSGTNKTVGLTTDGTKSGMIVDLSNITTALDGYYYIVVATSAKTDIQVDIDEIATDLNGKADTDLSNVPSSKAILTESYVSGTSWYRVYSDGWCEQGGYFDGNGTTYNFYTMALLKNYVNTDYSIFTEAYNEDFKNGVGPYYFGVHNKTTSSFQFYSDGNMQRRFWKACGYIR